MTRARVWSAIEVFTIFALVMANIWIFYNQNIPFTIVVLAIITVVLLGFILRFKKGKAISDYAEEMGLGRWEKTPGKWWYGYKLKCLDFSLALPILLSTAVALVIIVIVGLILNHGFWQVKDFWEKKILYGMMKYVYWGIIQQFLLQGFVTNRICQVFASDPKNPNSAVIWLTTITASALFAIAHLPNPVLTIATPILGGVGAYLFLKCRNIYLLGLAHGILGVAIREILANGLLKHGMRIGPGFWN